MNEKDQLFMQRAIDLAYLGRATVSPNPMVGCVIVHKNKIIGEGWHQKAGEGHAEVRAIASVGNKDLLRDSIAYVTLEPCAHFGRTPPCANLLVDHKLKRVVIACTDPNPLVAGKGIKILDANNIEVELGCLQEQALDLNRIFFHGLKYHRPYVILKWAETSDGFVARENFDSKWISNSRSRQVVHKMRSELDAILVGKNTAHYDDPTLNVRSWSGENPIRVVFDHHLKLSKELQVFDGSIPSIIYNLHEQKSQNNTQWVKCEEENFLSDSLLDLYKQDVRSILVEGGSSTLQAFIDAGLWNEAYVFTGEEKFVKGIPAPILNEEQHVNSQKIDDNNLKIYRNKQIWQNH